MDERLNMADQKIGQAIGLINEVRKERGDSNLDEAVFSLEHASERVVVSDSEDEDTAANEV